MNSLPSGTVTFLFTDIEGSTKLAQQYPDAMPFLLARHNQILHEAIEAHNGYVFQVVGDSFAAAFHSATDALHAAADAQRALQNEAWTPVIIKIRMGIHTGSALLQDSTDNPYSGYATLASTQRIMSAGHGGQVLLSGATRELVRDTLPTNTELLDLGEKRLKDLLHPEHLYQLNVLGLPSTFLPLKTLDSFQNNLPTQITSFIGREKELADVKKLLQDAHMLTLIGPGGTGKTRLSIQSASESMSNYNDGVWLVELAPILDPLLVPRTTSIAIGLPDEPQRPVIDMLCDYLREKKMLIVLDNCEHLVDACAQMANKILQAAPNVRILASSREALGITGEVTYRVPSLGLPDIQHIPSVETLTQYESVKLFVDRATSIVPAFTVTYENVPALAQICCRLDGIPLAIELAAAKVRVLNLEQISNRLDDRFRLLTGGSRTAMERHQTLRATIDWSYNLLPATEQVLFRRLSIFINGWTIEAAEVVCSGTSVNTDDVLDLLEHLINKSMVSKEETQQETRYRMLETMRQYANEKLIELGESDALREHHLDFFLQLAETAAPHLIRSEQLGWLARLDADYENIRIALEWALSKESAEPSLRLCAALGWFWSVRGYWVEGTKWIERALHKPRLLSKEEDIVRVRALYQAAALANGLDDLERMERSARSSLTLAQEVSDRHDIAVARFYVGWSYDRYFDHERAIPLLQESIKDFKQLNDIYWESVAYRWLGNILMKRGEIQREEKMLHHLELARQAGERQNLAEALSNWVYHLFASNQLEEVEIYAEEASMVARQIKINLDELENFYAHRAWLRGNYKETREILKGIRERSYAIGNRNVGSLASADLGFLALQQGDVDQARPYLEEALAIAREVGNKESIATRLAELGNTFFVDGNLKEFKQKYRDGISLGMELGILSKRTVLIMLIDAIHPQNPDFSARILGAIYYSAPFIHPLWKRLYDRAEEHARNVLGDIAFEATFEQGHNMSLDEALVAALKTVEEM